VTALAAVLGALATYRLALLVTADTLTGPWRESVIRSSYRRDAESRRLTLEEMVGGPAKLSEINRDAEGWKRVVNEDDDAPAVAYLITCPWCSSVYLAVPVAVGAYFGSSSWWFLLPAAALAFSAVAGYLATQASP
jgi:hypothetical protein